MSFETNVNSQQIEYFRRRLLAWQDELLQESHEATALPQISTANQIDPTLPHQTQGRHQKLLAKVTEALCQIEQGTYGSSASRAIH